MPDTPAPGASEPQQQTPFGQSSITGATPNKGYEAAAKQRLGLVIKQLTDMLQMAGATTDLGKDILKWINAMSKHVQPGEVSPASERNNIERMAMQNAQQGGQVAQMRGGQQQPAPGGMQGAA